MIPNSMIRSLIMERNYIQQSVINEVSDKWGREQQIVGPILIIPYKTYSEDKDGKVIETIKYSNFLPEELNINGEIFPENRKRGIYNVVLYQSIITCSGRFKKPDFSKLGIDKDDVLLEQAFLQISIPDMSGINEKISLKYKNKMFQMEPGIEQINGFISGVKIPIDLDVKQPNFTFDFDLNLNGSHSLSFGPVGKETIVKLTSSWESPSFIGSFLPDEHTINKDGFTASWKILDLNRNYPQSWIGEKQNLLQSSFGLQLIQPVDEYAKIFRSAKYALLVIALTFMVFFFIEIINKQQVHPMQYILVGLAISIFYVLLLSLSEHIGFNNAYLISSLATIGLIGTYSTTILSVY